MKINKHQMPAIVAVLLLSVAAPSCGKHKTSSESEAPEVSVASPEVDSVLIHRTYPGVLIANRQVELMARVDGYLRSKNYNSGDLVKEGTVLFRIEDTNYRDQVQQAEAALSTAEANLQYASSRYSAMVEALKGDAVSEMEVQQAKSTLAQCEAAVKQSRAALETARTQLSYCTVTAPFTGHISSAVHDVGSYLNGAASPVALASIYEDATVIAQFSIEDNATLARLRENIKAGIIDYKHVPITFSDAVSGDFYGELDYMAPSVDTSTGTIILHAVIDNTDGLLKSGMYASVDLPVATDPRAILVKDGSIGSDQLGKYLYVVNDSDKVVYTPIKTGDLVRDSLRIVTSGIRPTDRYVTQALLKVRDGMTVKPITVK